MISTIESNLFSQLRPYLFLNGSYPQRQEIVSIYNSNRQEQFLIKAFYESDENRNHKAYHFTFSFLKIWVGNKYHLSLFANFGYEIVVNSAPK